MARTPTVIVVGGGNAALCAAISAAEHGAKVQLLERAPETLAGGNSRFTAGAMRVTYNGVEDLKRLMPELSDAEIARVCAIGDSMLFRVGDGGAVRVVRE